ncbi:MAG: methylated-DNA--[protein]-cysteine S-methyltransferase [Thermoleophilia bacterium]|nr:methylated-DNA--[protein]-cysteine S-methyltransferase [Thermoleophilia bacterium]
MTPFSHTIFDTRLGPAVIAATGGGIIRLDLPAPDPDELVAEVARSSGLVPGEAGSRAEGTIDRAIEAVDSFLEGESIAIEVDVDWRLVAGFTRRVLQATVDIPYGETRSYGEIAIEAGSPGAHRAAGSALSRNPVALIVPCHRVIRGDGDPGDYGRGSEGRELKRGLLALESDGIRPCG